MRDYTSSIPNIFRVESMSNVNLLDSTANNSSNLPGASIGLINGTNSMIDCAKSQVQNYQQNEEDRNETINFHNNSMLSYPSGTRNRNSLDVGRCGRIARSSTSINTYNVSPIGDRMAFAKYSQNHNNGYGSDLNSSMNSISPSAVPPLPARRSTDKSSYLLWVVTPVAASISVAIVVAALAGPQWLFTEERVPNNSYTGIPIFDLENDEAFVTKYTKSSLWILCYTFQGMKTYNCVKIDCFPEEQYRPDPQDSTLAIPYTIVKSAPFFVVSAAFLLISFFVFLIAACTHQNSLYYFTAGILFIVSGLLMLIGLIAYISIFKAEVGSKLRPKSTLQPPPLKFTYGHSFFLYVFGFVSTEFVGVLNIFLFISLQQVGHHKTIPCLSFMNTHEKVKDLETANIRRLRLQDNDEGVPRFICKKHSVPANMAYESDVNRRYYFEGPLKCDLHSKDIAKSLNELYTEPAPTFQFYELPQEFPLTRSVSTATEIYSSNASNANCTSNASKKVEKNNKKNESNNSKDHLNDICGLSRGILAKGRKSKDELFKEFCKKAGMRPKPKDIYYIEDIGDQEEESIFIVDDYSSLTKNRRNSYMEPRHRNSNSSHRPFDKTYPKSLFDLDRYDSGIWNNCHDQYLSRDKLRDDTFVQTRTLPRCFMKRNFHSNDLGGQQNPSSLVGRYNGGVSKNAFNSNEILHKSYDDINSVNTLQRKLSNNLSVQWPAAIPTSPSSYSMKSMFRSNSEYPEYQSQQQQQQQQKFSHKYEFEEEEDPSNGFESFDLDQIERERRKSHASLFELGYDMINGTAV